MSDFAIIDWILGFLILLMILHGFIKGFVEELFSWAALVLAAWAAFLLYPAGGALIRQNIMQDVRVVPELLAFIVIFVVIIVLIKLVEGLLKSVITGANLGGLNKFFGAIFGLVEGIAITALVLFVLSVQPLFDASNLIGESFFAELLLPFFTIFLDRGTDAVDVDTALLVLSGGFNV